MTNKKTAILISIILAAIASLCFLILRVTDIFIAAYIFTLIAIALNLFTWLYLLENSRDYPWAAAIPQQAWAYLGVTTSISIVAVIVDQVKNQKIPVLWFIFVQAVILLIFVIRLIMLSAGKKEIERVGEKVKESTFDWKMLIADVEALAMRCPEVKPLVEAVKYSDPVTSQKIAESDEKIRAGFTELENVVNSGNADRVGELVTALQSKIKDRNNRVKLLKG
jgi:hypothetical protein